MTTFFEFLDTHEIAYVRHDHPAVYTVEEADRLVPDLPGAKTKNLFLRDDKGKRHFLVNTSTLVIKKADSERFLDATGHGLTIAEIPA